MKKLAILFALLGVFASAASAVENHGSVGLGDGIILPSTDTDPCPPAELCINFDGSAENGYCWQYGGIVPPTYGAFAECCDYQGTVCGIELLLSGIGYPCNVCDLYVWDDGGGMPGNVLTTTGGNNPCPVATWPSISTHDVPIPDTAVHGLFWFGYAANTSAQPCGYFLAADTDWFFGCPFSISEP
jgi:hypothetical protein